MTDIKNGDTPASPTQYMDQVDGSGELYSDNNGLTKREHFAAMAMQGLLSNSGGVIQSNSMCGFSFCNCNEEDVAKLSTTIADALLLELSK